MAIDPEKAREYCSELEYTLFLESLHPAILEFNEERIRKRVVRAQQLRDLWTQRVRSEQERAAKSPSQSTRLRATTGYVTASLKAELFIEMLERFEIPLQQMMPQSKGTRRLDTGGVNTRRLGD